MRSLKKRVLIATDSLGAPRINHETVYYEDTWPYKIKSYLDEKDIESFILTDNGLHSKDLLKLVQSKLILYRPCITVFQYGIVDCAPRAFTDKEKLIFRALHIGTYVHKIGHKYHAKLSSFRNIPKVPLPQFVNNVRLINESMYEAGNSFIVNVPIANACSSYIKMSPNIQIYISKYNEVLKKNCDRFVGDLACLPRNINEEIFLDDDYHHLNILGHELFYKAIKSCLNDLLCVYE